MVAHHVDGYVARALEGGETVEGRLGLGTRPLVCRGGGGSAGRLLSGRFYL